MKKNIKRDVLAEMWSKIENKETVVLVGARQTGKSYLLNEIFKRLKKKKKNVSLISLEDKKYLELLNEDPKKLLEIISLSSNLRTYCLIDEIQYLDDPTNFIKYFYDVYKGRIKLVVTGSSSFYIDRKFKDSLVGRKYIFRLNTLSFTEFVNYRSGGRLVEKVRDFGMLRNLFCGKIRDYKNKIVLTEAEELRQYFAEYSLFGGYPRVVLSETVDEKVNVLKDIADSYLKKDIFESDIRNENAFYNLIRLLASEIGNLVNINSISDVLGLSRMTVEKYLYVLQKSFHINLISPFTTNIRRELIKMKKVFFSDIGLRNYLVDSFEPLLTRDDKGGLFENMVYIQVRNRLANVTRFWRYKDNEVDFILIMRVWRRETCLC